MGATGMGMAFNNNGTKIYIMKSSTELYEWDLSTPYTMQGTISVNQTTLLSAYDISFNDDGLKMFTAFTTNVSEYHLTHSYVKDVSLTPSTAYKNDTLQGWCNVTGDSVFVFNYSLYKIVC
jgi:hypothetical protein